MRTRLALALAAAAFGTAALPALAGVQNTDVVISQVYGGGGNAQATFTHDFIEIHNRSSEAIDVTGWSVQYASTAGTTWQVTALTGIIPAGGYYLIQEAQGAGGTTPLPTPDASGSIAMAATNGKVALVLNSTPLTGACPTGVVDFVGFGSANCFEGAAATPVLANTTAAIRNNSGCTDTNNNNADFTVGAPTPRNSASDVFICTPAAPPSGIGSTSPSQACRNQPVTMFVQVTQGNPPSAITSVVGDTLNIGGGPGVAFLDDGVMPDVVEGDGIYTAIANIAPGVGFFAQNVPVVITDALGRTGNASVTVNVVNCDPRGFGSVNPAGVCPGSDALITVTVTPGINPPSTGITVFADLNAINGSGMQQLLDDGLNGDALAGDNIFSFSTAINGEQTPGTFQFAATIIDEQGRVGLTVNFPITIVPCVDSGSTLVISQVYGGGGNNGATYTHDFVELFNRSTSTITLNGKSIQYASTTGEFNANNVVGLSGSIAPGGYFLIQLARGAGGTTPLPTADLTTPDSPPGTIAVGSTGGRVALVDSVDPIGADCTIATTILDLVGYGGGSTCQEGAATAPTTDNTTSVQRVNGGCQDFNQNVADFFEAAPAPRNSSSPTNSCGGPAPCLADFNGDGLVFPDDLSEFITCFFLQVQFPGFCPRGDFNGDGLVFPDDLSEFITNFFLTVAAGGC